MTYFMTYITRRHIKRRHKTASSEPNRVNIEGILGS